jgi:hypothetical protein
MSWANIVKGNATTATTTALRSLLGSLDFKGQGPTAMKPEPETTQEWVRREIGLNQESLATIEKENASQCRPTWVRLKRPDAPQTIPIFKTREELDAWEYSELIKNQKYSQDVFEQRTQEWRIKHNWILPPMKTTVSKDEQTRGFYFENGTVSYVTPFSTDSDLHLYQIQETMIEMLWCLIHSRSDELVACSTVADFKAMFERNVHMEPDLRHAHVYSRRKDTFPLKMLWLISQKANVFPGKARPGSARWTTDPYVTRPSFDPEVYSKSMIFFSSFKCRDSKNAIVIGQHGGREETGICVVQQLKQNGDAATIRWLLSAKQLREMERVTFHPECSPFRESIDYDSDDYY